MKSFFIWGTVLIVSLILQSTLLPVLAYAGIHADLLLIVVISLSLLLGKDHGAVIGFTAGLLQDLASGTFFGMNTFSKMILGYFFGMAERQVFKEHMFLPIMAMVCATIGNCFITAVIMLLLGYQFNLFNNMVTMLVPLLAYHVILAFPIHKLIYRINLWTKR